MEGVEEMRPPKSVCALNTALPITVAAFNTIFLLIIRGYLLPITSKEWPYCLIFLTLLAILPCY